jgi:hypothetical protein
MGRVSSLSYVRASASPGIWDRRRVCPGPANRPCHNAKSASSRAPCTASTRTGRQSTACAPRLRRPARARHASLKRARSNQPSMDPRAFSVRDRCTSTRRDPLPSVCCSREHAAWSQPADPFYRKPREKEASPMALASLPPGTIGRSPHRCRPAPATHAQQQALHLLCHRRGTLVRRRGCCCVRSEGGT